jgi:H+/Cl- antiporter ClcA
MIGSTYGRLVGMFVVKFYKKLNIEEGTWVLAISLYPHMQYCHINLCSLCVIVFALNRPWRHYSFVQMGMLFDGLLVRTWHNFYQYSCRYALLGAASFLGGSMRMTVSLCVIMVEITNNLKLLPLIMLVLLVSKVLTLQSMTPSWTEWMECVCWFQFM